MSLLFLTALLSADPTVQPAPAVPVVASSAVPAAKPKKPKLICKSSNDETGSHMVKRTCLTQEEWDTRVKGRSADELGTIRSN